MAQDLGRVEGADEIIRKLRLLPERLGRNAGRRALRKGANVIMKAARQRSKAIDDPETREMVWKNIAVQSGGSRREKRAGGPMMRVGVRGGARLKRGDLGLPGGNTTYWRMLEFGTSNVQAQPFMRPAMNERAGEAFQAIVRDLPVEMDKELAKLGRR